MKLRHTWLLVLPALGLFLGAQQNKNFLRFDEYRIEAMIDTPTGSYFLLPRLPITLTGDVAEYSCSDDGKQLLVTTVEDRSTPEAHAKALIDGTTLEPPILHAYLIDTIKFKPREIRIDPKLIGSATFLNGSTAICFQADPQDAGPEAEEIPTVLTIYNVKTGVMKQLNFPNGESVLHVVSPEDTQKYMVLTQFVRDPENDSDKLKPSEVLLVDSNGVVKTFEIPEGARYESLNEDSTSVIVYLRKPGSKELQYLSSNIARPGWKEYVHKPVEEKIVQQAFQIVAYADSKGSPIEYELWSTDPALLKSGKAKLPLGKERILSAILSPKDNFVAYTVDYSLRIRPIAKVPPEVAKLIKDAMAKRETMQNAKQMGLAILMYSGDCDDLTPPKDGLSDIIQPYLRMNIPGFVYTLEGGKNLGEIANPAETEMGYINGPGGRAIVYADGHVNWKPDK